MIRISVRQLALSAMRCPVQCLWLTLLLSALGAVASEPVPKVRRLQVYPSEIILGGASERHQLLVTATLADEHQIDVTGRVTFITDNSRLVVVSPTGECRGVADGTTVVKVRFGSASAEVPVTIKAATSRRPPSFRRDIEPLLTRGGCNAGACHGKLAGQNGFKLSLRGYAPEMDHAWLTTDLSGRRINPAFPEASLLLLKPLGLVAHEGRQRFDAGSRYHHMLADWITARCPGPDTNETELVRLEVLPGNRVMRLGETQQLLARAHYAADDIRDVTWLAQFFSNDESTAVVGAEGMIRARSAGETSIRVHFQGHVEVVTVSIPYENEVRPRDFPKARNPLDEAVGAKLRTLKIPSSGPCDDATFLRRVSLDATGTLPEPAEIRRFAADPDKSKRANLVERLLKSPEFVDYWTLQLADLLQNRKERDHDVRGTKGVRGFHAWLRQRVAANQSWNALARDLLTASGDCVSEPAVGYFITTIGEKKAEESDVVDSVAQAFLGTRVGCARCHNHPLEKFTQDDYYHFAAFFSKVSLDRKDPLTGPTSLHAASKEEREREKRMAEMVRAVTELQNQSSAEDEDAKKKLAEQQKKLQEARRDYERAMAKMPGVMQPRTQRFMAPQPLDRSHFDFKPGEDLRRHLAEWVTSETNAQFSAAMVNRIWRHFMGVGLVEPVDDLRASNPPSNPQLWAHLNGEFVSSGYDLRHLMRLIMNSRTYQRSAETVQGNRTDRKFFSHYYARRLPAEVMLDAIATATGVPDEFKGYPVGTRAIQLPEPGVASYFLTLFGRSDRVTACACERNGEVTLPQLLHLQNGDVTGKVRADGGRLKRLLKSGADDDELLDDLFLATLGRVARPDERREVQKNLVADEREECFTDLFWALLNAKEFAFNH